MKGLTIVLLCLFIFENSLSEEIFIDSLTGNLSYSNKTIPIDSTLNNTSFDNKYFSSISHLKNPKKPPIKFHVDTNITRWGVNISDISFYHLFFDSTLSLMFSNIKSSSLIFNCIFQKDFEFGTNIFDSNLNIDSCNFNGLFSLRDNTFNSKLKITKVKFDSTVIIKSNKRLSIIIVNTIFKNKVYFENNECLFFNFDSVTFQEGAEFSFGSLPTYIFFKNVIIKGDNIDFTRLLFKNSKKKCFIDLTGTDIDKIKIDFSKFSLWFSNSTHEEIILIYEKVLSKLYNQRLGENYKKIDIEYKKYIAKHSYDQGGVIGWISWYLVDTFQEWWWNYGYNKSNIFIWTFLLWVSFFLITFPYINVYNSSVYKIEFLNNPKNFVYKPGFIDKRLNPLIRFERKKTDKNLNELKEKDDVKDMKKVLKRSFFLVLYATIFMLVHRIVITIIYTGIIFFGLKMDTEKFSSGVIINHRILFLIIIVYYTIGVLCVGFIANFIFQT